MVPLLGRSLRSSVTRRPFRWACGDRLRTQRRISRALIIPGPGCLLVSWMGRGNALSLLDALRRTPSSHIIDRMIVADVVVAADAVGAGRINSGVGAPEGAGRIRLVPPVCAVLGPRRIRLGRPTIVATSRVVSLRFLERLPVVLMLVAVLRAVRAAPLRPPAPVLQGRSALQPAVGADCLGCRGVAIMLLRSASDNGKEFVLMPRLRGLL